jgi:hypothetical protein
MCRSTSCGVVFDPGSGAFGGVLGIADRCRVVVVSATPGGEKSMDSLPVLSRSGHYAIGADSSAWRAVDRRMVHEGLGDVAVRRIEQEVNSELCAVVHSILPKGDSQSVESGGSATLLNPWGAPRSRPAGGTGGQGGKAVLLVAAAAEHMFRRCYNVYDGESVTRSTQKGAVERPVTRLSKKRLAELSGTKTRSWTRSDFGR